MCLSAFLDVVVVLLWRGCVTCWWCVLVVQRSAHPPCEVYQGGGAALAATDAQRGAVAVFKVPYCAWSVCVGDNGCISTCVAHRVEAGSAVVDGMPIPCTSSVCVCQQCWLQNALQSDMLAHERVWILVVTVECFQLASGICKLVSEALVVAA